MPEFNLWILLISLLVCIEYDLIQVNALEGLPMGRKAGSRGKSTCCGLFMIESNNQLSAVSASISKVDDYKNFQGGEYCDTEVFRAECSEGEVIILDRVRYGRMKLGRCVEISLGYLGCNADVTNMADKRCSGKRVCEIRVPDAEFESTGPCLKELKTYLEASYSCVPVTMVSTEYCNLHNELNVTQSSGYIASVVTSDSPSCVGTSHPWVIGALPGQRINLTLYDFAMDFRYNFIRPANYTPGLQAPANVCREYGVIMDSGRESLITICGSSDRVRHLLTSVGSLVKIWVTAGTGPKDLSRFVIHYQVIGCPEPEVPEYGLFERTTEGHGYINCMYSEVKWPLICQKDGSWSGQIGNCSLPLPEPSNDWKNLQRSNNNSSDSFKQFYFTNDYMFAWFGIILGVCVIVVSFILLICALLRRSRRRRRYDDTDSPNVKQTNFSQSQPLCSGMESKAVCGLSAHEQALTHTPPRYVVNINGTDYEQIWQTADQIRQDPQNGTRLTTFSPPIL